MAPQPKWREAVTTAEQVVAPHIDGFLRSDTFAGLLRTSLEVRATMLKRAEPYTRAALHALNLPTASDVRLLRRQVADLERQLAAPPAPPASRPRRAADGSSSRTRAR